MCAAAITSVILINIITLYASSPSSQRFHGRGTPIQSEVNTLRLALLKYRPADKDWMCQKIK